MKKTTTNEMARVEVSGCRGARAKRAGGRAHVKGARAVVASWLMGALGGLVVMLAAPGVAMANQQQAPGLSGSGTLRLDGITGILGDVVSFLTGPFIIATSIIGLISLAVTYQLADDGSVYKKVGRYLIATMVALTGVQIVLSMASGATF